MVELNVCQFELEGCQLRGGSLSANIGLMLYWSALVIVVDGSNCWCPAGFGFGIVAALLLSSAHLKILRLKVMF